MLHGDDLPLSRGGVLLSFLARTLPREQNTGALACARDRREGCKCYPGSHHEVLSPRLATSRAHRGVLMMAVAVARAWCGAPHIHSAFSRAYTRSGF